MSGLTKAQQAVFNVLSRDPAAYQSSYLHNAYRRGQLGVLPPNAASPAYGAWLAGRQALKTRGEG